MSAAQQAKAKRRQHARGFTDLPARKRPHYKRRDAATSAQRLARQIANERRMQQSKKK